MAGQCRSEIKNEINSNLIRYRGGITSDGAKVEENGKKYYEFIIHYLKIDKDEPITKKASWKMVRRDLFIVRWTGSENSQSLRETIDK